MSEPLPLFELHSKQPHLLTSAVSLGKMLFLKKLYTKKKLKKEKLE